MSVLGWCDSGTHVALHVSCYMSPRPPFSIFPLFPISWIFKQWRPMEGQRAVGRRAAGDRERGEGGGGQRESGEWQSVICAFHSVCSLIWFHASQRLERFLHLCCFRPLVALLVLVLLYVSFRFYLLRLLGFATSFLIFSWGFKPFGVLNRATATSFFKNFSTERGDFYLILPWFHRLSDNSRRLRLNFEKGRFVPRATGDGQAITEEEALNASPRYRQQGATQAGALLRGAHFAYLEVPFFLKKKNLCSLPFL